ncbi:MAG: hypothetical protein Kow0089_14030 [Desulfobulbaceae bacterium]
MGLQYKREFTRGERRFLLRVVLAVSILALLWILFAPGHGFFHYHRLRKQIDALTEENRTLQESNAALQKEIDRLQHDDAYLEELARRKYGLLKENETVYEADD